MLTYLVTGAAGFIASKVCEMLLAEGHMVVGVDNLNDYYDVRLKLYRLGRLAQQAGLEAESSELSAMSREPKAPNLKLKAQSAKLLANGFGADPGKSVHAGSSKLPARSSTLFEFRVLDIENLPALEEVFKAHKFEAVFNLAARAGVRASLENPEIYRTTNILGEENVLKCQVKYGVRKHVLASSSSVYAGCPMPFTEDATLGKMQSPYAETKRAAELLAREYHGKHGLDVTVLRYFTVFGPAGRPDMAPFRFIKWIDEGTPITLYGDGTQARDFTYVDDIARGTILAGKLFGGQMPGGSELRAVSSELSSGSELRAASGERRADDSESPATGSKLEAQSSPLPAPSSSLQIADFQHSTLNSQLRGHLAPTFDIINLGGGRNPMSLQTMIGLIEKALTASRQKTVDSGQLAVGGGPSTGDRLPSTGPARISAQPPSAADIKETWADITKAGRLLHPSPRLRTTGGWTPQVTPQDGFQMSVDWHIQNREWLKDIKL